MLRAALLSLMCVACQASPPVFGGLEGLLPNPVENYAATLSVTWPDGTTTTEALGVRPSILVDLYPAPESCHHVGWLRLYASRVYGSSSVGALPVPVGSDSAAPLSMILGPDAGSASADGSGSGFWLSTVRGTLPSLGTVTANVQGGRLELSTLSATLCQDGTCVDELGVTVVVETDIDPRGAPQEEPILLTDCDVVNPIEGSSQVAGRPLCWNVRKSDECTSDTSDESTADTFGG